MNCVMLENLKKDISLWNQNDGFYDEVELWRPEIKIFDDVSIHTKIFEIIGNRGELISFDNPI